MGRGRQAVSCSSIVQVNTRGHYFSRRRFIVICQRDFVFPRTTTNQPTIPRWVLIMFVLLYIDCQFHRHKVHKVQSASEGGQVLNLRNNRSPCVVIARRQIIGECDFILIYRLRCIFICLIRCSVLL